jgi:N-acetylated-alpha-linked acidic dipeptidase
VIDVLDSVEIDVAWDLVERFSKLVRESGSEEEREAARLITRRLDEWKVPYQVHEPELLISVPRRAELSVDGRAIRAKTPSMAPSGEVTGDLVHEPAGSPRSINELFDAAAGSADVAGKLVLTEGLPMPARLAELERRGALGAVFIQPGERIHEGICTPVWGSPDTAGVGLEPRIPVVSVNRPDGEELVEGLGKATIKTELDTGWRRIPVIVAELRGRSEPERFVLLHGHLDSWHVGVGDNATGDATLLEAARVLGSARDSLERSVRIAWWSGHSHGRYAGSAWYAAEHALDIERNCVVHVNCDSPGCRDATVYEDVYWMAETEDFAKRCIRDFTGLEARGRHPLRAGDISFNNLGVSTFFMLSSTMEERLRRERGLYAVGGCGGNIEWHTEADTLEIADRDNLLRDMRLYAAAVHRAATEDPYPLDFRATLKQLRTVFEGHAAKLDALVDLGKVRSALDDAEAAVKRFHESARNDVMLELGRPLVRVLYAREGPYRQDPALEVALLPDFAVAAAAVGQAPDGAARIEALRARNRLQSALLAVSRILSHERPVSRT